MEKTRQLAGVTHLMPLAIKMKNEDGSMDSFVVMYDWIEDTFHGEMKCDLQTMRAVREVIRNKQSLENPISPSIWQDIQVLSRLAKPSIEREI